MAFPRGTTPTFELVLPEEFDLSTAKEVRVTFVSDKGRKITKSSLNDGGVIVTANVLEVFLTQYESFQVADKTVEIQANWTYNDGKRWGTQVVSVEVDKQLLNEVM